MSPQHYKANRNNYSFDFTNAFGVTIETNVANNVVDNRLKKIIELVTEDNQISASQIAKVRNPAPST